VKKLKIYICDLTHTGLKIANDVIPLGIGYISSYAKQQLGALVDIKLFKYPEVLLDELEKNTPDILCFASYGWNDNLNDYFCDYAKKINNNIITLKGGPNFPLGDLERSEYLKKRHYLDFYLPFEGELSFSNFLETVQTIGMDVNNLKMKPIKGCVFLKNDNIVVGDLFDRIVKLDDVPSPYLNGMLDEFFDGKLSPIIETTRGCPFKCNYCNSGEDYYTKVRNFSLERVKKELHYIGQKVEKYNQTFLIVTDMNFGMYAKDYDVALEIVKCQELYNWPLSLSIETGKNKIKNISKVIDLLKKNVNIKISIQSNSEDVLKAIKRYNIKQDVYVQLCETLRDDGQKSIAELILPLPEETYQSYLDGIKFLVDSGVDNITNYTLQLNYGTEYRVNSYLEEYGYETYYRLYASCVGKYNSEIIFEAEKVGIATKTLSKKEYFKLRKLSFLIELVYNNSLFKEIYKILEDYELKKSDFILFLFENIDNINGQMQELIQVFLEETKNELFYTEDEIKDLLSKEANYNKVLNGEIGRNIIYANKADVVLNNLNVLIDFLIDGLIKFLNNKDILNREEYKQINNIKRYLSLKLKNVFDSSINDVLVGEFTYDIYEYLNSKNIKLEYFKKNIKLSFYFNKKQQYERNDYFRLYGNVGASTMVRKVLNQEKLVRSISYIDESSSAI